jgi:hypothetical protein
MKQHMVHAAYHTSHSITGDLDRRFPNYGIVDRGFEHAFFPFCVLCLTKFTQYLVGKYRLLRWFSYVDGVICSMKR